MKFKYYKPKITKYVGFESFIFVIKSIIILSVKVMTFWLYVFIIVLLNLINKINLIFKKRTYKKSFIYFWHNPPIRHQINKIVVNTSLFNGNNF